MITKDQVINLIGKKIPNSQVFVENIKGNDHLQVTVIASEFNGLSLVKQHQLVYSALKEEFVRSYPCTCIKNRNTKLNYGRLNKN